MQFAALPMRRHRVPGPEADRQDGDPVDLATGLFVYEKTDVVLPDVIPIALTRTYRPNDDTSRAFRIGTTHTYDMFLIGDLGDTWADLILPDGGRVHFVRTSPGTGHLTAVMEHTSTPTAFQKAEIRWNSSASRGSWDLTMRDGTVYEFGNWLNNKVRLVGIVNRHGQRLVIQRSGINVSRIISPHGRILDFTTDASNRVTSIRDNLGREVTYEYDGSSRLWRVTDQGGGVTEFTYDASHRMLTLKDPRGIVYLTNQYDGSGRVSRQTQADQTTYDFAYAVDGSGQIVQADVTDPRGLVRRVTFNSAGYWLTDTAAFGTSLARTATAERQAGTHYLTAQIDGLGRRTEYTYDAKGNVLTVTRLAGTGNAVTTTLTYQQQFSLLASVTDPLGHATSLGRDGKGNLTSITDALNHQRTFTYSGTGLLLTAADAAGTTQFGYDAGDLVSITDPLGRTTSRFVDVAGRLVAQTDPLGRLTQYTYTPLSLVATLQDARGGITAFTYDGNGNLLTLTDALNHTTMYTYNAMDRVTTRTDPLSRGESYVYDANGNLTQVTDRKNQVTAYSYDVLDRLTQVTYHDASTTVHTYDVGDRLTQVVDSIAGTITRGYDGLDRLTSETTPEGSISYTYDAAARRATMTVTGQPQVAYTYDNADRLTSITQSSATVSFSYEDADRRTVLTLPNGVTVEYGYDTAAQITSLTYKLGATTLGDLSYTYDLSGRRTSVGGTWARTGLPNALASATYDAANQIATFGSVAFTYDANGNLTSDGTKTYSWNARDQLTGLNGSLSASFQYDGVGRRRAKTVSGASTAFLYDGLNAVQELASGSPSANILSGLDIDEWLMRTDSAETQYFGTDAPGNTVALLDGTGAIQTQYTYEPFGKAIVSGAENSNAFQFTGRENDEIGLYYYRARYYDPVIDRFLSEDPLQERAGINFYSYVGDQPTGYIDPSGMLQLCCRPVNMQPLRWLGACHCFLRLSNGGTLGGYNKPPGILTPIPDDPDDKSPNDKCPNDKPKCTDLPGQDGDVTPIFNRLPRSQAYGDAGTSNATPRQLLTGAGIPFELPPCAWGNLPANIFGGPFPPR
jgi:RHS repeat-associated protein